MFFGSKTTRSCPYCGEKIKREAIKCRFCGEFSEADNEQGDVCIACQIMTGLCVVIVLVGVVVLLWQSGGW